MEPLSLSVVPMRAGMAAACAEIAATAPDPWQFEAIKKAAMDENRLCLAALHGGQPVGFACFLAVGDAADLQLIAVKPEYRRRGVAKALLAHALARLAAMGIGRVLLEARASNHAAIALYKGLGFAVLANRPGMYAHPREDGVLMALAPKPETKEGTP